MRASLRVVRGYSLWSARPKLRQRGQERDEIFDEHADLTRLFVGKAQDVTVGLRLMSPPEVGGRASPSRPDGVVEPAYGAEPGLQRDAPHRKVGPEDQRTRAVQSPRLRDGDGGGAEMDREEAVELASAHTKALRQPRQASILQRPVLDQPERAADRARRAVPARRSRKGLGAAATAGAKT